MGEFVQGTRKSYKYCEKQNLYEKEWCFIEQINLVFTYITNNIDNSEATLIQHHVGKQSSQVYNKLSCSNIV